MHRDSFLGGRGAFLLCIGGLGWFRRGGDTPDLRFTLSRGPQNALAGHLVSVFLSLVVHETFLRDT